MKDIFITSHDIHMTYIFLTINPIWSSYFLQFSHADLFFQNRYKTANSISIGVVNKPNWNINDPDLPHKLQLRILKISDFLRSTTLLSLFTLHHWFLPFWNFYHSVIRGRTKKHMKQLKRRGLTRINANCAVGDDDDDDDGSSLSCRPRDGFPRNEGNRGKPCCPPPRLFDFEKPLERIFETWRDRKGWHFFPSQEPSLFIQIVSSESVTMLWGTCSVYSCASYQFNAVCNQTFVLQQRWILNIEKRSEEEVSLIEQKRIIFLKQME